MAIQHLFDRAKVDYDEVYEAGKKAQQDEFWDSYQDYGQRQQCNGLFAGVGWSKANFKPKYSMNNVYSALNMFWNSQIGGDLAELLEELGIKLTLNTGVNVNVMSMFTYSVFTRIPSLNLTKATNTSSMFAEMTKLVTIDELIVSENTPFASCFNSCSSLENLKITGTIAKNGFNVQWSTKLSKASITSVINALSTTTSGLTVTFSKTAVETAFGSTTSQEWLALVATKSNWTISLV